MDSTSSNQSTTNEKSQAKISPAVAGAIGVVAGLIIGGAGIYGLTKLNEKPTTCPTDNCINPPVVISNSVDFDFLNLEADSKNIIYSPLSIRNGLALLSRGADGATKTEIDKVLGNSELPKYEDINEKLSLANAVFIRNTYKDKVLPTYETAVKEELGSGLFYDEFKSTDNMDQWVKQKTFGLIDKIGIQITDDLEMVLANALAIQMDWKNPFDADDTHGSSFYKSDGTEINATTMYKKTNSEEIKYYQDDSTTAISMPLDSTSDDVNLDFIAIMPSTDQAGYIKSIDQSKITPILDNLTSASESKGGVAIRIPKFKFDYKLKFKEDLLSLGMKSAFSSADADFSKMATTPLYIGEAIHKANIDFSEDGVKAAAITVFGMKDSAMPIEEAKPITINIDHQFLFLIRDRDNGTIWFTGAVFEPNLWADEKANYEPKY